MALIIMMLMFLLLGNMIALGLSAIMGSIVWAAFFMLATSGNLYALFACRKANNA